MNRIFLYIAVRFLFFFALASMGVGVCIFLADVVELLRKGSDVAGFGFITLIQAAILHFPFLFEQALPFVVLIAAMASYATLTGSSELVALRASGVSAWQFIAPTVVVVLGLGVAAITVLNPLAIRTNERFDSLQAIHLGKEGSKGLSSFSKQGIWVKEASQTAGNYTLSYVGGFLPRSNQLTGVMLFFFVDGKYYARVDAATAQFRDGGWFLESAWLTAVGEQPVARTNYFYPTSLSPDRIKESLTMPEQVSFWQYPSFIKLLMGAGLDTRFHQIHYGTILAKPIFLVVMLMFGVAFSLRTARRGHRVVFIALGILSASAFYIFDQFIHRLAVGGGVHIAPAIIAPLVVGLILSLLAIAQVEEG